VIDASGSVAEGGKLREAKRAAASFLRRLKSSDRASLLEFSGEPRMVSEPAYDRAALEALLSSLAPRSATGLYGGVDRALEQASRGDGRAALLVLSDGLDQNASGTGPGSSVGLKALLAAARVADVQIFPIGLGRELKLQGARGERVLQAMARASGGTYAFAPTAMELRALFQRVIREVSGQAKVSFRPLSGGNDGG